MAEPASGARELAERLALAGLGAFVLSAERLDALAEELARRGGMRREDARALVEDVAMRWRGDAIRITERAGAGLQAFFRELGLVTREEFDDLELRVAQAEHRLRLAEETLDERSAPSVRGASA